MKERLQIAIVGVVQGVGFRPFVHRLATELELAGWVRNDSAGVTLEVEGSQVRLLSFLARLPEEAPPAAHLYTVDHRFLAPVGHAGFEILASEEGGEVRAWLLPDLGTCPACRDELFDPADRRHRYPFLNCTHCGPRFTIIDRLPYDRHSTSMASFEMCPTCQAEYEEPTDRRFHAQPNACATCGPRLWLESREGEVLARDEAALEASLEALHQGLVVGVKGLGGYHLMVDARSEAAVAMLRRRKERPTKPFALMYPDLGALGRHVELGGLATSLLRGSQAPILLLPRRAAADELAPSVAPGSPALGVFLPYTPLHHLLLSGFGGPLVATSANASDAPIVHEDEAARRDLRPLVDRLLLHDRPIRRPADDSVLQLLQRPRPRPQTLRRARGYAPLPLLAPRELPPLLATGGHLNVTFALSRGREVVVSQHLGELGTLEARETWEENLKSLTSLYGVLPGAIAHDLHPDYFTTEWARERGVPTVAVQHHHAHLAAVMLEHELEEEVLGLCWDGTGDGGDGTIWGGEALLGDARAVERVGSLWPFLLPGGEAAIRQPWRIALALLREAFGEEVPTEVLTGLPFWFPVGEVRVRQLLRVVDTGVHSPTTTSMGRLFDGLSALLGLCLESHHHAQAPQALEAAAWRATASPPVLPLPLREESPGPLRLDWRPLVRAVVEGQRAGTSVETLAAGIHQALAEGGRRLAAAIGRPRVVLGGGVFCNRYLVEALLGGLEAEGLEPFLPSQLPPTDGALAAGQLWVAAHQPGSG